MVSSFLLIPLLHLNHFFPCCFPQVLLVSSRRLTCLYPLSEIGRLWTLHPRCSYRRSLVARSPTPPASKGLFACSIMAKRGATESVPRRRNDRNDRIPGNAYTALSRDRPRTFGLVSAPPYIPSFHFSLSYPLPQLNHIFRQNAYKLVLIAQRKILSATTSE